MGKYIDPYGEEGVIKDNQDQLYIQSEDPWDNRGTYVTQFKGIDLHLKELRNCNLNIVDLGCGGGNVLEGLIENLKGLVKQITVTGIDISPHAIAYLQCDHRFDDYRGENFKVGDFSSIASLPFDKFKVNLYSMVDVLCSVDSNYKEVSEHIWDLIPQGSYVLVADCDVTENRKFKNLYNNYANARIISNHTTHRKVVTPKTKNWSARFNWSIYQKLGD